MDHGLWWAMGLWTWTQELTMGKAQERESILPEYEAPLPHSTPPPTTPPGLSTPLTEALCWFSPGADPQLSPHLGPWRQLLRSLSLPRLFSLTLVVPKDQLDSFRGIFLFLLSGRSLPESALSDTKDILLPVIVIAAGLSLGRFPVNNIFVIMKFRESWEEPVSEFLKS